MKGTLLIILILFLFVNAYSQQKMSDREMDGLKGKVKAVYIEDADLEIVKGKPVVKDRKIQFDQLYDENGNITQDSNYYLGNRNIYTFIDGDKSSKSTRFETWNSENNSRILRRAEDNSKPRDKRYDKLYKYEFDEKGRVKEERKYDNAGELFSKTTYKFDDTGKLIEEIWYLDDKISQYLKYTYDTKGKLIERKFTPTGINGETSILIHRFKNYKFDAQGNWIQRTQTTIYTDGNGRKKEILSIYYRKIEYYK